MRPPDRPPDRITDISLYGPAIRAKKRFSPPVQGTQGLVVN